MNIDIGKFQEVMDYLIKINQADIEDLNFYSTSEGKIIPDKKLIEQWKYIGLNNVEYVKTVLDNHRINPSQDD